MRTGFAALCALLLIISFQGVLPGQPRTTDSAGEMKALLNAQAAAWNKGDIEGYMDGYWKSDSLIFTSGGSVRRGWNATFAKYKETYNTRDKMGKLEFSDLEITQLSDSSAWILGHWKLIRSKDAPGGVFTLVLRRFPDGWKIVHDHTSSDPQTKPSKK